MTTPSPPDKIPDEVIASSVHAVLLGGNDIGFMVVQGEQYLVWAKHGRPCIARRSHDLADWTIIQS